MGDESNDIDKQPDPESDCDTREVPDEVLERADACPRAHCCCRGNGDRVEPCRVTSRLGKDMLFVDCPGVKFCAYRQAFGYSHLCTCPVRYFLHESERGGPGD